MTERIVTGNVFDNWNRIKKKLDASNNKPYFSEGEIWWCGVGKNVGVEINGKSDKFSRPVLIFRKLNGLCFLAIPLTSQQKNGTWYIPFKFQDKIETAVLVQSRVLGVGRLYSRMGEIDESDYEKITQGFAKLFIKNIPKP